MSSEHIYQYYKDYHAPTEYSPTQLGIVGGIEICDANFNRYCEYVGAAGLMISDEDLDSILIEPDKIIVTQPGAAPKTRGGNDLKSNKASTLDDNLVRLFNDVDHNPDRELELPRAVARSAPQVREPSISPQIYEPMSDQILSCCPHIGGADDEPPSYDANDEPSPYDTDMTSSPRADDNTDITRFFD
jgi:hypothetical protein